MFTKIVILAFVTTATTRSVPESADRFPHINISGQPKLEIVNGMQSTGVTDISQHEGQGYGNSESDRERFHNKHYGITIDNADNINKQNVLPEARTAGVNQGNDESGRHDLNNKLNQSNIEDTTEQNKLDKTPEDNEVTPFVKHEITINEPENNFKTASVDEDRWIWTDGTTKPTTKPANTTEMDLDNRAAFDGGNCPNGQVRIKGTNMCVDVD